MVKDKVNLILAILFIVFITILAFLGIFDYLYKNPIIFGLWIMFVIKIINDYEKWQKTL